MESKESKIQTFKERVKDIPPIRGDEDFFPSDTTLLRYLKSRDWNIDDAEKMLRATIEYRKNMNMLELDCKWCHEHPGFHSMRQVGFDDSGRPVIYANFSQITAHRYSSEDSISHVIYLIENAKLTMKHGITTWVFIVDCSGMSLPLCNPKLGYEVTQILTNHYPERLGMVICVNHSAVFHSVWKAIKVFLHRNTADKVKLVRSRQKIQLLFQQYFSEELTEWLLEEMKLNKKPPLVHSQEHFWEYPGKGEHDPRGCPSYVSQYIDSYVCKQDPKVRVHKPHPNIIDSLTGLLDNVVSSKESEDASPTDVCTSSAEESDIDDVDVEIAEEYQIVESACKQGSMSG